MVNFLYWIHHRWIVFRHEPFCWSCGRFIPQGEGKAWGDIFSHEPVEGMD